MRPLDADVLLYVRSRQHACLPLGELLDDEDAALGELDLLLGLGTVAVATRLLALAVALALVRGRVRVRVRDKVRVRVRVRVRVSLPGRRPCRPRSPPRGRGWSRT